MFNNKRGLHLAHLHEPSDQLLHTSLTDETTLDTTGGL